MKKFSVWKTSVSIKSCRYIWKKGIYNENKNEYDKSEYCLHRRPIEKYLCTWVTLVGKRKNVGFPGRGNTRSNSSILTSYVWQPWSWSFYTIFREERVKCWNILRQVFRTKIYTAMSYEVLCFILAIIICIILIFLVIWNVSNRFSWFLHWRTAFSWPNISSHSSHFTHRMDA